jgi:hypothetical protein
LVQTGADADIEKYSKRTVRVTAQHNEECRRLLQLMGVPVIEVCTWPPKFRILSTEGVFAACHHPDSCLTCRHPLKPKPSARRCARKDW